MILHLIYEGYQIKPQREVPTCFIIVTDGKGGKIPDVLSGLYTTKQMAKNAIDEYLKTKPRKDKNEAGDKG